MPNKSSACEKHLQSKCLSSLNDNPGYQTQDLMHVKHTINHGVNLQPQVLQKYLGQEVSKAEHVIN